MVVPTDKATSNTAASDMSLFIIVSCMFEIEAASLRVVLATPLERGENH
jgi:hypothetical protein